MYTNTREGTGKKKRCSVEALTRMSTAQQAFKIDVLELQLMFLSKTSS